MMSRLHERKRLLFQRQSVERIVDRRRPGDLQQLENSVAVRGAVNERNFQEPDFFDDLPIARVTLDDLAAYAQALEYAFQRFLDRVLVNNGCLITVASPSCVAPSTVPA